MLKAADQKRLAICTRKKTTEMTNAEVAREFGCSERSVTAAIAWGKRRGILAVDQSDLLEQRIAEVLGSIEKLDTMVELTSKNVVSRLKDGQEINMAKEVTPLFKELRETQILLMELQGLYKQYVNIKVQNTTNVVILPEKITSREDWEKAVSQFETMKRVENTVGVDTTAQATLGISV